MTANDEKVAQAAQAAVQAARAKKLLRSFDFNRDFGPAIGMKRSQRAARAKAFSIRVPVCIEETLRAFPELDIEVTESSMMARAKATQKRRRKRTHN